jgi:membrane-associated phospholipid phosphatase
MNKRLSTFYVCVVVSIFGLMLLIQNYPLSNFDISITREIQEQRGWDPTLLMKFISVFGDLSGASISIAIASLLFFLTNRRREARFTLFVILPDLCNLLVKILVHRPRPSSDLVKVLSKFAEYSFPSGHVVHYVVFFGFLLAVMVVDRTLSTFWRIAVALLSSFLILTISISRIYLGAHWATDVIGGYLFGFAYLGVILSFYFKDPKFEQPRTG